MDVQTIGQNGLACSAHGTPCFRTREVMSKLPGTKEVIVEFPSR